MVPVGIKPLSVHQLPDYLLIHQRPSSAEALLEPTRISSPTCRPRSPSSVGASGPLAAAAGALTPLFFAAYSMYGHVDKLADEVEAGVKSTGAEVTRLQVPETLTDDILQKMHAPPKREFKVLHDPSELLVRAIAASNGRMGADRAARGPQNYDGFLFGFPTRYGRAPAQVSALFDRTGQLWAKGALTGKFAGVFTSTASQHGGQETTALTTVPFFTHHGIICA